MAGWSSDDTRMPLMPLRQKMSATNLRHMNLWPRMGMDSTYLNRWWMVVVVFVVVVMGERVDGRLC